MINYGLIDKVALITGAKQMSDDNSFHLHVISCQTALGGLLIE